MSKEYRVIVQPEALEGINTAHQWIRRRKRLTALFGVYRNTPRRIQPNRIN